MAMILATIGSAYGTAKSGIGVTAAGIRSPAVIMKSLVPVIMAGMVGIYGLIIAIFISSNIKLGEYTPYKGFASLGAGLAVGFAGLSSGLCIGVVGDFGVRQVVREDKLFVGIILTLVFAEALGLYGLIVALILSVAN
uniref:V-type proton ATPase proteolipid subunit n=1 Tax=Arcella intermedia TaxID=1963864 RepID=A0A6B2LNJ6_9EUKA